MTVKVAYDFVDTDTQTTAIAVASSPTSAYQYRVFLTRQKCESLKITYQESQVAPYGEGVSLSGFALEAGLKRGLDKLPSAVSYG